MFKPIDKSAWKRTPYFEHYYSKVRCSYSVVVNLDITALISLKKRMNGRLYPLLVYALAKAVNNHEEFRISFNENGELGVWDYLNPCYAVYNKTDETFSNIWTQWDENLERFLNAFDSDNKNYGSMGGLFAKPDMPANIFTVSCLPDLTFTGFNIHVFGDGSYLAPIFTYGKYFEEKDKTLIPISVQVHHAVCDGFHVSRFVNEVQGILHSYSAIPA